MNWSNVKLIFQREVRDQLRDRRTLFMIAVLPVVLYPLLGMSLFQMLQFVREQPTKVLVVGAKQLPESPALFEEGQVSGQWFSDPGTSRLLHVQFVDDEAETDDEAARMSRWRPSIDRGEYDAVLIFPPKFRDALAELHVRLAAPRADEATADSPVTVPSPQVLFSTASEKSQVTEHRIANVLERWTKEIGRENLSHGKLPANAAQPFELGSQDLAVEGHRDAALWSKVLPFLLLIWALTGAFYPAVDLCPGEKERGTLETLLSSPAERTEIVWGKLLTVMLFSVATAALNLLSLGVTGSFVCKLMPQLGLPPALAPVWLLIALLPVSAMFSALCVALASFARSSKEGQYYLMPLVLIVLPLVVLPMAPGVEMNLGNSLIPVTGIVLLLRSMLEGNYSQALLYGPPVLMVTLACCLLAIRWAVDQFNSESVLFRESERFDLRLWLRQLLHDREDTPTVAGAVFCGVMILMIKFFIGFAIPQPTNFGQTAKLILVTQLVVVATPALLMTIMLTRSPTKTLLLRRPAATTMAAAGLLAVALHPAVGWLGVVIEQLYPISPEIQAELKKLFVEPHSLWVMILVMAVMPAVCEEIAFRGFILSGMRHVGHKWRAIAITSLFFGVTHALFQQSIVTFFVGCVLGYVAVQTGSLFPAIAYHVTHNTLTVLLGCVQRESFTDHPLLHYVLRDAPGGGYLCNVPTVIIAGLIAIGLLAWLGRLPYRKTAEEALQDAIQQHASHAPSV